MTGFYVLRHPDDFATAAAIVDVTHPIPAALAAVCLAYYPDVTDQSTALVAAYAQFRGDAKVDVIHGPALVVAADVAEARVAVLVARRQTATRYRQLHHGRASR